MASSSEETERPDVDKEFIDNTTLHGIGRVAGNGRPAVRLTWLLILLVCLGVCVAQITDRFQRFFRFDASTAISVEYVGDLDFPAVTICNFNRYRASELTASDLSRLADILATNEYDYDSYDESASSKPWTNDANFSAEFNYTEFTLKAGFVLDSRTLLECSWRGKSGSCSDANFSHVFTSFGNCWTFNLGANGSPILKEIQAGAGNGLRMLIDIQQSEYTEPLTGNIEAGLKVLVHDQGTPPMIDAQGLAIQPGVHAFVSARKNQFINLEEPYGKCDASKALTRYSTYTLEGCNIECRTEKILQTCGCRLVRHPGDEEVCSPDQSHTCANDLLSDLRSGKVPGCPCPVPCNFTTFTTSLSTAAIPNQYARSLLIDQYDDQSHFTSDSSGVNGTILLDENYIRDNWIILDVFYEDINFQLYQQSEAITVSALISDIGGQLGLFLGASFITLAEILSYLGQKVGGRCRGRKSERSRKTSPDSSWKNKTATTTA